jgi:acyl carrier protein
MGLGPARRRDPKRLGLLGLRELLEPALRRLTAVRLGVPADSLRPDVSFQHDLAVDALALARLVVEIERELGLVIPEHVLDRVRTFGDLVDAVVDRHLGREPAPEDPVFVRATIESPRRPGRGVVEQSAWLTPYAAETIAAEARRHGSGTRLVLRVPAAAPLAVVERVERRFAPLAAAGVAVDVHHERPPSRRAVA